MTPPARKPPGASRIAGAILRWYARNGRQLPWRNIRNPYRILVSEIMLHQTQVSRVLALYPLFLKRFPTLRLLAGAERSAVVIAWRGLGYNNRAVRLHELARTLVRKYAGKVPSDPAVLSELPGIGRYTAHALLVSVYRRDAPVVDVNVRRVLSRLFWRMRTTPDLRPPDEIWNLAEGLVPPGRGYEWTQALMDLGATICTARSPSCAVCPVTRFCSSAGTIRQAMASRQLSEPSLDGTPNRIYRGKVVEFLRTEVRSSGVTAGTLGRRILPRFLPRHEPWLRDLLLGLQKDGIVRLREARQFHRTLVRLA
jgi:A/G-specific adenine glycosylase